MNFYQYHQKFGFCAPVIKADVPLDLKLSIVIPCYNEENLIQTLDSLEACSSVAYSIEVIIVVNASTLENDCVLSQNQKTIADFEFWNQSPRQFSYFLIEKQDLPPKKAGVGLARKIGMDEAAKRLEESDGNGAIVCLDADCTVAKNYVSSLCQHLEDHPQTPGFSIYFEHPLSGDFDKKIYQGIQLYELFLRYYTHIQRVLELPYAFHTVGSSMAVRPEAYMKQGGMNKRKAGEDFYFIHKIIQLGQFTSCTNTCVYPSPRVSDRVPFGTGKAIGDWIADQREVYMTYSIESVNVIKHWLALVPQILEENELYSSNENFNIFLKSINLEEEINRILKNTSTKEQQFNKFFQWFDAFKLMKALHYLRDNDYPLRPLTTQAQQLINTESNNILELLVAYRQIDKQN